MVAGLAHESRNALQRSQAALERIESRVVDRPELRELIANAQKAQDHLLYLFNEVRDYAAPVVLNRRRCLLAEVLRESWDSLSHVRKGRDATLSECGTPHLSDVAADPIAMQQVFRNILENSLAASADPMRAQVRWRTVRRVERSWIEVLIGDNGPGFTAQARKRLFEPFFTTKTKGTGLGLAIARRLVEAHGGFVRIGAAGGAGAEVIVSLPREPE
jgi:signal transduction histidine kinase